MIQNQLFDILVFVLSFIFIDEISQMLCRRTSRYFKIKQANSQSKGDLFSFHRSEHSYGAENVRQVVIKRTVEAELIAIASECESVRGSEAVKPWGHISLIRINPASSSESKPNSVTTVVMLCEHMDVSSSSTKQSP